MSHYDKEVHEVARDGAVWVCQSKCKTCIFNPGNLMSLNAGRVAQMVNAAIKIEGMIPCHNTIRRDDVRPAICRGFFDSYGDKIPLIRLAKRMGLIKEQRCCE